MEWQNILLAMLRDGGLDRDGRRITIKVETSGCQAGDFLAAQAGHEGDHVDARPFLPRVFLDGFTAILGRFDESAHFVWRQCSARMPDIDVIVEPFDTKDRVRW
jgi:hypothetical protein